VRRQHTLLVTKELTLSWPGSQPTTLTRLRRAFYVLTEHAVWRTRPTMETAMIGMLAAVASPRSSATHTRC
jgi:hypothetical protein